MARSDRLVACSLSLVLAVVLATLIAACSAAPDGQRAVPSSAPPSSSAPSPAPTAVPYANPDMLVDADWLAAHLSDPGVRVVALAPRADYLKGHVPGAVQIDWPDLQVTDTSDPAIAAWRTEVESKLGNLGITAGDTVVVYDHGTIYAARLWWILDQLGHKDKRLLNGGIQAWQKAGKPVSTDEPISRTTVYQGQPDQSRIATWQSVLARLKDPQVALVDARSPDEYAGKDSSGAKRAGHIPGAVNVNYVENARSDEPRLFKSQAELTELYTSHGVTKDRAAITYCTTGVRASVDYFALRLIGYPDVRVYTGSWAEWGNRDDLPIEP